MKRKHPDIYACACGCNQPVKVALHPSRQARFIFGHGRKNGRAARYPVDAADLILSPQDDDLRSYSKSWRRQPAESWGYIAGSRSRLTRLLHRIVAERMLGRPLLTEETVDHINQDRGDNRRENLRVVPLLVNKQNNARAHKRKSQGTHGVYRTPNGKRWAAYAHETHSGKQRCKYLGTYDTMEAASAVFEAYKRALPGYVPPELRPERVA